MLFIYFGVNILEVVTKYDLQLHAVEIINVDYILLKVKYVNVPMVFNSRGWTWNMYNWKSSAHTISITTAFGLYARHHSHNMTGPVTIYQYVHTNVKDLFAKIVMKI